jgi:hypothetical protein
MCRSRLFPLWRVSASFALLAASDDANAAGPTASATASAAAAAASPALANPHVAGGAVPLDDNAGDGDMDGQPLPAGHPSTGAGGAGAKAGGHAGGGGPQANGVFEPPPDLTDEAMDLPPGVIVAQIVDATEKPLPNAMVTIGILNNSVAKGESRKKVVRQANALGELRVEHLETDSHIAYRVTVPMDGATFAAPPFRLPEKHGMRVKLHVYPVTHDVEQALIVTQAIVYVEMKDDRVQIQEAISVWNFGAVTWVPENVVLALPSNFTGFSTQQGMTDTGVDSVDKVGVKMKGTFTPGRHEIEFRWQLPYDGEAQVIVDAGMPPHLAAARTMVPASKQMVFSATGFPPAISRTDGQGQRVLVSERQMSRGEAPLKTLHLELRDLPTQGPGRYVATSLTVVGLATGIALALQGRSAKDRRSQSRKKDQKDLRKELLLELVQLEDAHNRGDIGPQTYARARRELIDQIALTFAPAPAA